MKILILTHAIPPYCGGAEHVAWNQAKYMAGEDDVHILTFGNGNYVEERDNITIHFLPDKKNNWRHYFSIGRSSVRKVFNELQPDVIHEHMPEIFGYVLRNEKCLKVETFHHGTEEEFTEDTHETRIGRFKRHFLWRGILKEFDALTTVSKWHSEYCTK